MTLTAQLSVTHAVLSALVRRRLGGWRPRPRKARARATWPDMRCHADRRVLQDIGLSWYDITYE
jgi:hypothetical protein